MFLFSRRSGAVWRLNLVRYPYGLTPRVPHRLQYQKRDAVNWFDLVSIIHWYWVYFNHWFVVMLLINRDVSRCIRTLNIEQGGVWSSWNILSCFGIVLYGSRHIKTTRGIFSPRRGCFLWLNHRSWMFNSYFIPYSAQFKEYEENKTKLHLRKWRRNRGGVGKVPFPHVFRFRSPKSFYNSKILTHRWANSIQVVSKPFLQNTQ